MYRGTCAGDGESPVDVAVKQMDLAALKQRDPDCEKTLMREITVMRELEHPNILRLLDWKRETDQISMALELLRGRVLAVDDWRRQAAGLRSCRLLEGAANVEQS